MIYVCEVYYNVLCYLIRRFMCLIVKVFRFETILHNTSINCIVQRHVVTAFKTHLCLASRKKALANSVDPDETPHDAASHQGLRCLLKGMSVRNILNIEINILNIPNFGNKLIQIRRMGESTGHKWVITYRMGSWRKRLRCSIDTLRK